MKKKYMKPTMRKNNRFVDDPDWNWDEGGGQ